MSKSPIFKALFIFFCVMVVYVYLASDKREFSILNLFDRFSELDISNYYLDFFRGLWNYIDFFKPIPKAAPEILAISPFGFIVGPMIDFFNMLINAFGSIYRALYFVSVYAMFIILSMIEFAFTFLSFSSF